MRGVGRLVLVETAARQEHRPDRGVNEQRIARRVDERRRDGQGDAPIAVVAGQKAQSAPATIERERFPVAHRRGALVTELDRSVCRRDRLAGYVARDVDVQLQIAVTQRPAIEAERLLDFALAHVVALDDRAVIDRHARAVVGDDVGTSTGLVHVAAVRPSGKPQRQTCRFDCVLIRPHLERRQRAAEARGVFPGLNQQRAVRQRDQLGPSFAYLRCRRRGPLRYDAVRASPGILACQRRESNRGK